MRVDTGPPWTTRARTTPRLFFVLEQSWTEPFVVLGAAAVVVAACRAPRLTPWLFGALVPVLTERRAAHSDDGDLVFDPV